MTQQPLDIEELIAQKVSEAMGQITGPAAPQATAPATAPQVTFEQVLEQVDPRDSDAALAMLDFLLKTNRLGRVGVLDGGQGYLFVYAEPKGSSKQGYVPGGTQGDRIVDEAVETARASGAKPRKSSICVHCFSGVHADDAEGFVLLDGVDDVDAAVLCKSSPNGQHQMA